MAIRSVVLRGFGNGTFNGTIALVVTKGYAIGEAVAPGSVAQKRFSKPKMMGRHFVQPISRQVWEGLPA